jgi:hypothetical protein
MNYTYLKNVSPAKGSIAIIHNNKPYFKAAKSSRKRLERNQINALCGINCKMRLRLKNKIEIVKTSCNNQTNMWLKIQTNVQQI